MKQLTAIVILLALCGSLCAQELPIKGTVDVAELFQKNDELLKRIHILENAKHSAAQTNLIDYGVVLNDPKADNGPAINALLNRCGSWPGAINNELYLPGGACYFSTPIEWPTRTGISLRGNGVTTGQVEGNYREGRVGGPASRLIYVGPPDKPAVTYKGVGGRIEGVTFQRGLYPHPRSNPPADGSIGLSISANVGLPTAKLFIPHAAFIGWDCAIEGSPGDNNGDSLVCGYVMSQNNNTFARKLNPQGVDWTFQHLAGMWHTGVLFDCVACGGISVTYLELVAPATVFRVSGVSSSNGDLTIQNMKVDNNAAGWQLLEQTRGATFSLYARGMIGNNAGAPPMKLYEPNDKYGRLLDVRFVYKGAYWDGRAK